MANFGKENPTSPSSAPISMPQLLDTIQLMSEAQVDDFLGFLGLDPSEVERDFSQEMQKLRRVLRFALETHNPQLMERLRAKGDTLFLTALNKEKVDNLDIAGDKDGSQPRGK